MIKIGISVTSSHAGSNPVRAASNMIERARAARDAGLDSLFVGDHHVTPTPYMQNNVILARMLAEWGDKPYGALYLLPLWHPVLLAEQVGTLAALGTGQFIMQCGLGDERQGRAMGIDMSRKVGMFVESLRTMRSLWAGEPTSEDRYWQISDAVISPVPAEPVDVWVGAQVDKAIERTARLAEGWLASPALVPGDAAETLKRYLSYCDQSGRTPTACAIRRDMYIGSSAEDAVKVTEPYKEKGYRGMPDEALLIGSVEQVAEQLSFLEEAGYTDVIVRNMSSDQAECLASIERLAEVKRQL